MIPHGGYKRAYPEDFYGLSRSGARRGAHREIEEQIAAALHPAEIDLMICDAASAYDDAPPCDVCGRSYRKP